MSYSFSRQHQHAKLSCVASQLQKLERRNKGWKLAIKLIIFSPLPMHSMTFIKLLEYFGAFTRRVIPTAGREDVQ
jgi:hypothetical protein